MVRKVEMAPELHEARDFQKIEKCIFPCQKILQKIIDVDNVEIYKSANFEFKLRIISGSTKITNQGKIQILNLHTIHRSRFGDLSFLSRLNYNEFFPKL